MAKVEQKILAKVHEIATERKIKDYDVSVRHICSGGGNYTSSLYVAKIITKGDRDLNLFVKAAMMGAKMRSKVSSNIFNIEKLVYTHLKKAYRAMEDKYEVPEPHRLYMPEYYGASIELLEEMLVIEDLGPKGFTTHDRLKPIDWPYAAAAVNELAKLHALSIAFQRENPDLYKLFIDSHLVNIVNDDLLDMMITPGVKSALAVLKDEHKGKLQKFFEQLDLEKLKRQCQPLRFSVLAHGDFRPSNLMHRTLNDGTLEIVVIDHQTIQVGSPVNDLLYLIFTGTDKEFRAKHFNQLTDHYYTQLSDAMRRLDIDPDTTYSRADFEFELKEKLPFGLTVAAFTLPIVTVEAENAPEVHSDMDLSSFTIQKTGAVYPDRINGVVDDFVAWGILRD